ncbi:MAG: DNA primase [Bacteroidetes bacterium]|nr:DNA primase [Bacteroidota bacterium]
MRIPKNVIEQVRDASDILSIAQDYVRLKKAGRNYLGLCPFHSEKTASFNVSPAKGFFKCFGCGKGGDTITFVMEIERLEFLDAIRWLADRAGIEIPKTKEEGKAYDKRESVYAALRFASEYYVRKLKEPNSGARAREYLHGRSLTEKTITRFSLGYAPDSWDSLIKAAADVHIKPETLEKAGLIIKRDDGSYYDRFRGRIMFPIRSHVGKIIGFGGRILVDHPKAPKYLNSSETDVYHKSNILYGLYQSKRMARQEESILLVEGYTDVLALDQAGVGSAACCGTALTLQQVTLLGRYVKEIRLLYDADRAGMEATERAIDVVLAGGVAASVVSLPEGEDPDSFVREKGADAFKLHLKTATKDWIDAFFAASLSDDGFGTLHKKRQAISGVAKRIAYTKDDILRKMYVQKASQLFAIPEGDMAHEITRYARSNQPQQQPTQTPPESSTSAEPVNFDAISEPEKMLLQLMLEEGGPMIEYILGNMGYDEFQEGPSRKLVDALIKGYETHGDGILSAIQSKGINADEITQQLVAHVLVPRHEISEGWEAKKINVPRLNENSKRIAQDCMMRVKGKVVERDLQRVKHEMMNAPEGSEEQSRLQKEYLGQKQYLLKINNRTLFDD